MPQKSKTDKRALITINDGVSITPNQRSTKQAPMVNYEKLYF